MNNLAFSQSGSRKTLFWRLWFRSIKVRRPQAALAAGSLLVGAAVTAMLLNLYGDVRRKMTREFSEYGANVVISPAAGPAQSTGSATGEQVSSFMDAAMLARLAPLRAEIPGLVAAPQLYVVASVHRNKAGSDWSDSENLVAVGTELAAMRAMAPNWRVTGGDLRGIWPADSCAVGAHLAAQLHLKPGDRIAIRMAQSAAAPAAANSMRVASIIASGAAEDDQIFVPLADLQRLAGLEGKISLVQLNLPGGAEEVERGIGSLKQAFPGLEVRPIRQIVYSQGKVLETIRGLLISLTALILLIIALCVIATMTAIVLERRKDIATMKALGASNHLVMELFLAEGASLGLVSGIAGFGIGAALASALLRRLFGVELDLLWWTLPAVCASSMLLAVIATFFPVKIVRRIQPAMVLKGE